MDIFIRMVPQDATTSQLENLLRPPLGEFGVHVFECHKMKGKRCAFLTISDKWRAELFLQKYGTPQNPPPGFKPKTQLQLSRSRLLLQQSKNEPNPMLIRALKTEMEKVDKRQKEGPTISQREKPPKRTFEFVSLQCGVWDYDSSYLSFMSYYKDPRQGSIIFGRSSLVITLRSGAQSLTESHIDIPYWSICHILHALDPQPTVSFTLRNSPRFYNLECNGFDRIFQQLSITPSELPFKHKKFRVSGLQHYHTKISGLCYVYRITLASDGALILLKKLLRNRGMPPDFPYITKSLKPQEPLMESYRRILDILADYSKYQELTFQIRFQIQKLVHYAILSPTMVLKLLPKFQLIAIEYGEKATVTAIKELAEQLPIPSPDEEAKTFHTDSLVQWLRESAQSFQKDGSIFDLISKHDHLALVHRATITPCSVILQGPFLEVGNRVLRQYKSHDGYFIRVTFAEEDGETFRYDPRASQKRIYEETFKNVLAEGIPVAGRTYAFLGFSHSSLRSQTCWFSAPFIIHTKDGYPDPMFPQEIIKTLGSFSHIRCPAKCAARIGQAFSDTTGAVTIHPNELRTIPDIERNGRCFSDGCGTISPDLLKKVHQTYALSRNMKPTLLQIRFAGAKGVVSVDSRLKGNQLCIRPSMTKFEANMHDIEICGASFKPLNMYLNRSLIQILEDLGVEKQVFLELQEITVTKLREMTLLPVNAATFLEWMHVGSAAQTPSLIRRLSDIGLKFQEDDFLRGVVEICTLTQLRDLKYRARIPVEMGVTLYGIMDETGILEEGEIYCAAEIYDANGEHLLQNRYVTITRSPALHPGDVQIVMSVGVPKNSPLKSLRNCVVFSQKGSRDLASQLSGGDLDGDLYHVLYDRRLMPKKKFFPADYGRPAPIDIGREVTRNDMTDFFLQFMETDQLGRISMIHMQLADRYEEGTWHPDCIKLAEMASIAVDFSKTGIPVKMEECPKHDMVRPDFMAPGPKVLIQDKRAVLEQEDEFDLNDPDPTADPDARAYRYYPSSKVLGELYRSIDEKKFIEEMRSQSITFGSQQQQKGTLMEKLWAYINDETRGISWMHHKNWASQTRDAYETNLAHIAAQFSPHHRDPLEELEIFSGCILGKSPGAQNRRLKQSSKEMNESFDKVVQSIMDCIKYGDDGDENEALPRAVACLASTMEGGYRRHRANEFQSCKYVAAAACLRELELFRGLGPLRKRYFAP